MRKMNCLVLAILAIAALGSVALGCQSCRGSANLEKEIRKSKEVPAAIADAKLLSYKYTLQGTMRYPLYMENVEICKDDSTRCIIRLFEEVSSTDENFDENGEILPDSLIAGREVLDSIKQMLVDAKAWRFKEDYNPREETKDGYSWGYTATFSVTDSLLASVPEAQRARLLRRGGLTLTSGGSNASPDTKLFQQIRLYLRGLYNSEKNR